MIRITHDGDGSFTLWDGDKSCGGARATFGDTMTLLTVDAPDDVLAEGLVRAALNAGRERGCVWAACKNAALFPLLDRLAFEQTADGRAADIPAFFARGCRGSVRG